MGGGIPKKLATLLWRFAMLSSQGLGSTIVLVSIGQDDDEDGGEEEDDDDGFFVPHGYLSEDEGVTEVSRSHNKIFLILGGAG